MQNRVQQQYLVFTILKMQNTHFTGEMEGLKAIKSEGNDLKQEE